MPTFKPTIRKDKPRADKAWLVYIRISHNRESRYISTNIVVEKKDLTTTMKIKNQQVLDVCTDIIRDYRKRLLPLGMAVNSMPLSALLEFLRKPQNEGELSFTDFCVKWLEKRKNAGKNHVGYQVALNSIKKFFNKDNILIAEINTKNMRKYEEYLWSRSSKASHYPAYIKFMFNEARNHYNDEDNGLILIHHSLERYTPPKQSVAKKRALTVEQIRQIFALPYEKEPSGQKLYSRFNLALDCFRLSFCLMGTNAIDMYNATDYDGTTLRYKRAKTHRKRDDEAYIEIVVPDVIKPLMEKYKGKDRTFCFSERSARPVYFDNAIAIGMNRVGKKLGLERLNMYAARHSMATIAYNDVGIEKSVVNDMLNHTDTSMRVTDLYIKKSFKPINDANAKLMTYVFGDVEKK